MVANFLIVPRNVQVWVRRFADIKGFQNTVQLPVTIEKTMPNMVIDIFTLDIILLGKHQLHLYNISNPTMMAGLDFKTGSNYKDFKSSPV